MTKNKIEPPADYFLVIEMTECSCPICPLVAAKMNTRSVVIQLFDKGFNIMPRAVDKFKYDFESLALIAKDKGVEIGKSWSVETEDYEFHVKRIDDTIYTICFHTFETDSESDPEAMD